MVINDIFLTFIFFNIIVTTLIQACKKMDQNKLLVLLKIYPNPIKKDEDQNKLLVMLKIYQNPNKKDDLVTLCQN